MLQVLFIICQIPVLNCSILNAKRNVPFFKRYIVLEWRMFYNNLFLVFLALLSTI